MSEKNKHWREVYPSDFLASWDLESNVLLTIKEAKEETCKLAKGKEIKVVLHFVENALPSGVKTKPMICIPTNCKMIQMRTGLGHFAEWSGVRVEIGIGENKGGIGNSVGLRIVNVLIDIDISHILKEQDPAKVREDANKILRSLSPTQKETISDYLKQLENV